MNLGIYSWIMLRSFVYARIHHSPHAGLGGLRSRIWKIPRKRCAGRIWRCVHVRKREVAMMWKPLTSHVGGWVIHHLATWPAPLQNSTALSKTPDEKLAGGDERRWVLYWTVVLSVKLHGRQADDCFRRRRNGGMVGGSQCSRLKKPSYDKMGSRISALHQLKGWFESKTSIQEYYRNANTKLILNLCMNCMVHVYMNVKD